MPTNHGIQLDDDKHVRLARPAPTKDDPEGTVDLAQVRAARGAP